MLDRLNRAWRIVATAISFGCFGIGGVVLWLVVFPLLTLFVRDPKVRGRLARRVIHRVFRAFVFLMHRLGVLTYEIRGAERLDRRGLLVLANHPTLIDVVFLISLIPDADCVVKSRLLQNPFTRGPVRATGYICNDGGPTLVEQGIDSLRSGKNLVIFPEGTRTRPGAPLPLQRGAANIAVRGAMDVTPVRIRCSPSTLGKGDKWYRVPSRRFHMSLDVGDDIAVAPFLHNATPAIAARRLTEHLYDYFELERPRGSA